MTNTITKTILIRPAKKTPGPQSIPLSLMDKIFPFPCYVSTVHIYRPSGSATRSFFDSEALRESLSKVLVHFYPMAGRFVRPNEEEDIMEIDCNDEGISFVEEESDSVLDDLGDLSPSTDFKSLLPFIDNVPRDISTYPLMLVQMTRFRCGGVSLGITVEHHAVDGFSAFHLFNSWSEICRGHDISVPPYLDRSLVFRPRDPLQPKFDHPEYATDTGDLIFNLNIKVSVFRLTKDQLNEMKTRASENQETATNFTTFEVLAGHTWKCVCKARQLPSDKDSRLFIMTNLRSNRRVGRLLPPSFFGNAALRISAAARMGDLQSKALWYAASTVQEALARINDEYVRSAVDFLAVHPDMSRSGVNMFESPNFFITSYVGLGLNDADFGWGPSIFSGRAIKRKAALISTADDSEDLILTVALEPQASEIFENIFYEFVTGPSQPWGPKANL